MTKRQLIALEKMYRKFQKLNYGLQDKELLIKINTYLDYKDIDPIRLEQLRDFMKAKHTIQVIDTISYFPNLELAHTNTRK